MTTSLTKHLSTLVGQAFAAQDLPEELGQVRVSDRPELAQFQCNGAMAAAKQAKKNPREVAQSVVDTLSDNDLFQKLEIAGPGFINITLSNDALAKHMADTAKDPRLGAPEEGAGTIVLDYGGPNIAKPMHVGHLRAGIVGDTLRRMLGYAGFKTLGDVHLGDWGTHLGMLLNDYISNGDQDMVLNTDLNDPVLVQALFDDMAERYPKASKAAKEDEALKAQALETTVKLQNKEAPYYPMWEIIRKVSVARMKQNYAALNVHFDLWKGEADVHDLIAPMVEKLKIQDLAVESDGALIIHVAREDDKMDIPPLILYKRDGAVMYGTTDMATLVERMDLYDPVRILYVVDQRQSLHFEQVFRAARMGHVVPETVELTHAGFGTMNGTDGKPFKTRAGGVMRLDDLIQMGIEKALQRLDEADLAKDMDEDEKHGVAHKIAVAAIKFADLKNQRHADYVFDLDKLTSFEGKTGPYLLYQAVRIQSLLRKADSVPEVADFVFEEADLPLVLLLSRWPDIFENAWQNYTPHVLCEYAYELAQAFSSFYGNCHILSEKNEALKNSRLALCALTVKQLQIIFGLLGIEAPERM